MTVKLVASGSLALALVVYNIVSKKFFPRQRPVRFRIVIHGGAGVIDKKMDGQPYYQALTRVLTLAHRFAASKAISAVDIAEYTVILLEDEPLFNAGKGSVFAADGSHELEASIMDGKTLQCGAVSRVTSFKNPIALARGVMERTPHNLIIGGPTLDQLGRVMGLAEVENSYFSTDLRRRQLIRAKELEGVFADHSLPAQARLGAGMGTVGCVCMFEGHVASATSTGGLTNKLPGRVGDTPIVGAGTYASDDTAALSGTGRGEEFMRHVAAFDVAARMRFGLRSLSAAMWETVWRVLPKDAGGLIGVAPTGEYAMIFNSPGMFRGVCDSSGAGSVGIWSEMLPLDKIIIS